MLGRTVPSEEIGEHLENVEEGAHASHEALGRRTVSVANDQNGADLDGRRLE